MDLSFGPEATKEEVFKRIEAYLGELTIRFSAVDNSRPWGGFFVIDETNTDKFIGQYFSGYDKAAIKQFGDKLSPKILLVAPEQKLSWQYHDRRAELWRGVSGPVGYIRSHDDIQGPVQQLDDGEAVQFDPQERHRLIGLENWGVVAEIWQHTNISQPSDESDIVRLDDSYGR